jgi:hypothetical protein
VALEPGGLIMWLIVGLIAGCDEGTQAEGAAEKLRGKAEQTG